MGKSPAGIKTTINRQRFDGLTNLPAAASVSTRLCGAGRWSRASSPPLAAFVVASPGALRRSNPVRRVGPRVHRWCRSLRPTWMQHGWVCIGNATARRLVHIFSSVPRQRPPTMVRMRWLLRRASERAVTGRARRHRTSQRLWSFHSGIATRRRSVQLPVQVQPCGRT